MENIIEIKIINKIEILNDKYKIYLDKILGKGKYSNVYLGEIIENNKNIAIKKIKVNNLDFKQYKILQDEILIMNKIILYQKNDNKCKNIIDCYDIIENFDYIYIILEYCENGDLSKIDNLPLNEDKVKYYFKQLLNALLYLHNNNIIHRDIKPKNILLKNNYKDIVLCDFGYSKIKTGLTRINTICGSPLYMAPEIFNKDNYTEKIDIWSIGIILYELLYGIHPYSNCKDVSEINTVSKNLFSNDILKNINLSNNCVDLLHRLLDINVDTRISINQIYLHDWLK
jgi:serine/threonine-protein kinase ULK/ATG1